MTITIFYPDLSQFTPVPIEPGTVAVVAKATQGDSLLDTFFTNVQQQCRNKNIPFGCYHWLNHGNLYSQAMWLFAHVGSTPVMLDCEDMPGNDGYNGPLTLSDIQDFVDIYRAIGGIVNVVYLPHWYWQDHMGSPDLSVLFATRTLYLVSSNYTTYSDTGPGWNSYGGVIPTFWQYTDKLSYSGMQVDFNAFKGTIDQWWTIWSTRREPVMATPVPFDSDDKERLRQVWTVLGAAYADSSNAGDNPVLSIGDQVYKVFRHLEDGIVFTDTDRTLMTDFITAVDKLLAAFKAAGA